MKNYKAGANKMEKPKWDSLDSFEEHYHNLIDKICAKAVAEEGIAEVAKALWSASRAVANRSPRTLCFDCVYIAANATGNPLSSYFLEHIAEKIVGTRVRPMRKHRGTKGPKWYLSENGKAAIISVIGEDLYDSVIRE
jgi:hypothetical protein